MSERLQYCTLLHWLLCLKEPFKVSSAPGYAGYFIVICIKYNVTSVTTRARNCIGKKSAQNSRIETGKKLESQKCLKAKIIKMFPDSIIRSKHARNVDFRSFLAIFSQSKPSFNSQQKSEKYFLAFMEPSCDANFRNIMDGLKWRTDGNDVQGVHRRLRTNSEENNEYFL